MERTFRHARQNISISLNEDTNPQRYEWEIANTRVGGYAPLEWLVVVPVKACEACKGSSHGVF